LHTEYQPFEKIIKINFNIEGQLSKRTRFYRDSLKPLFLNLTVIVPFSTLFKQLEKQTRLTRASFDEPISKTDLYKYSLMMTFVDKE
jgi:hypothetical protein